MRERTVSRRQTLSSLGSIVVDTVAGKQLRPTEAGVRLAPRDQLVNVLEYEDQAARVLTGDAYAEIAGGDRSAFDRITLRPRMMVPVLDLDLSLRLFGQTLFAPILVAPIAQQARFHADGERATVTGASAARAVTVVSSHSSVPLAELMAHHDQAVWYQVFAQDRSAGVQIQDAVKAGCRAICVTLGAPPLAKGARPRASTVKADLPALDALRRSVDVPVLAKGISTPDEANLALRHGVQGLIVSAYRGPAGPDRDALILKLPAIVDAVGGRVPVLVDGGFRRGTDILKALAFGAQAVLIGRPVMWGLAAYGADGVQGVLAMLQTELARYMAMCGKSNLAALDRTVLRVHSATGTRG
jgi:4-hydroxymandelate oxidase